jgi:hypothetical protein
MILIMKVIKREKRQPLPKLNLPLAEWLDPQEPEVDLGLRAMTRTPQIHLP